MGRAFVLGLTGSIGMGKTTTAAMFADHGIPLWDADAAVHRLYSAHGDAVAPLAKAFPQALATDGSIDRAVLKRLIATDPAVLKQIETIVHPLVAADRAAFLAGTDGSVVLLDIPLLFEGGADKLCDAVAVVSVSADLQRARVMARGTMSEADLDRILARQMPDAEKRARARWVIDTTTMESARAAVQSILTEIHQGLHHA